MHQTVCIVVDAIDAAMRHKLTRTELPHETAPPDKTHGQMSYTSVA